MFVESSMKMMKYWLSSGLVLHARGTNPIVLVKGVGEPETILKRKRIAPGRKPKALLDGILLGIINEMEPI